MVFLIDASLPRDVAKLFLANAHTAVDVRDVGLRHATDPEIAAYAQTNQMALMSADFDFGDIRVYPPSSYFGLVIIDRPENATVPDVVKLVDRLLSHGEILSKLVGRLIIVDSHRIRIRPPLLGP